MKTEEVWEDFEAPILDGLDQGKWQYINVWRADTYLMRKRKARASGTSIIVRGANSLMTDLFSLKNRRQRMKTSD